MGPPFVSKCVPCAAAVSSNVRYRWNAALALADYLDLNTDLYASGNVLELGAGGALPSIVAANNGASKVGC